VKYTTSTSNYLSYLTHSSVTLDSKVLERLAAHQLMDYLNASDLLPSMQSGFRPRHSTETAVLRILADILQAVDCGDVAAIVLLDLSAAFDTVDCLQDVSKNTQHSSFCRMSRPKTGLHKCKQN